MKPAVCSLLRGLRTKKEISSYKREADAQIERISKLEASGADEYDIRKQVRLFLFLLHTLSIFGALIGLTCRQKFWANLKR